MSKVSTKKRVSNSSAGDEKIREIVKKGKIQIYYFSELT
jgi:hypothetical protein